MDLAHRAREERVPGVDACGGDARGRSAGSRVIDAHADGEPAQVREARGEEGGVLARELGLDIGRIREECEDVGRRADGRGTRVEARERRGAGARSFGEARLDVGVGPRVGRAVRGAARAAVGGPCQSEVDEEGSKKAQDGAEQDTEVHQGFTFRVLRLRRSRRGRTRTGPRSPRVGNGRGEWSPRHRRRRRS